MAHPRPDIPSGLLGSKPSFSELKLQTDSHRNSEFKLEGVNNVVIRIKTGVPIKTVTQLIECSTETEHPTHVLVQRKDKEAVHFHVAFPSNGWFKFLIFALQEEDPSDSLPNVYNYLISAEQVIRPAKPYPAMYSKFYNDCCFLYEPMVLNMNSKHLNSVKFSLVVPEALKVALHVMDEWFHLEKNGDRFEKTVDLSPYKEKGTTIQAMASYEAQGTRYAALLEYTM
ncbi:unnamed protein product [Lymnaea stagnalis]|uniref:KY-like immunoglobulin-like domain-containing protein n=1 Tax=Lymnaea stagnalis TaxID=6523 RepID=A0AAV2I908_LYMST